MAIMTTWIIPCNVNYYDIAGAFESLRCIDWKQSRMFEVEDVVYIYMGRPIKAITYKCRVNKVNLPFLEIDDSAFIIKSEVYENYGNYISPYNQKSAPPNSLSDVLVSYILYDLFLIFV